MGRELAIRLDDGTFIRGPGWMCIADVMASHHGFPGHSAYGTVVYVDTGEPFQHYRPLPATDGPTPLVK